MSTFSNSVWRVNLVWALTHLARILWFMSIQCYGHEESKSIKLLIGSDMGHNTNLHCWLLICVPSPILPHFPVFLTHSHRLRNTVSPAAEPQSPPQSLEFHWAPITWALRMLGLGEDRIKGWVTRGSSQWLIGSVNHLLCIIFKPFMDYAIRGIHCAYFIFDWHTRTYKVYFHQTTTEKLKIKITGEI